MNKELEALDRLWSETFGNNETSSFSNRSDRDLIKQALQDKDERIKELEEYNKILNDKLNEYIEKEKENRTKLNAIREVMNISKIQFDTNSWNIYSKIKSILERE